MHEARSSVMWSAPACHDRLCSRCWRCVLPIGIRLPRNLFVCQFPVACMQREFRKKTYTAIRLYAYELILEHGIWRQVHRRSPDGVAGRIKRYLRRRNVISDQNQSAYKLCLKGDRTALEGSQLPSCGTLPTTKMFC